MELKESQQYTEEDLREREIRYLARSNGNLVYLDTKRIYFFNPIGIRKEKGYPFFDSNNCEKYELVKKFKLEEKI